MALGVPPAEDVSDEEGEGVETVSRTVPLGKRVCIHSSDFGLVLTSRSLFILQMRSGLFVRWNLNQVCIDYRAGYCPSHQISIGIKLLGFKKRDEVVFEDNIKHSVFIHPDELVRPCPILTSRNKLSMQKYSGSKRTFTALLKKMIAKRKIGLVLALTRRNAAPIFCAMLPQVSSRPPCL